MGFLSSIWDWIKSLFGLGESRLDKEKVEGKEEKKLVKDTKTAVKLEKNENKQIKKIIKQLTSVYNYVSRNKFSYQIRYQNRSIDIKLAIYTLIRELERLVKTGTSIRQEEKILETIKWHWTIVRYGLINLRQFSKDVNTINLLFKRLEIDLKEEDKLTMEKIMFVKDAYKRIMEEERGKAT